MFSHGETVWYFPTEEAEPTEAIFLGVSAYDHRGTPTYLRLRLGKGVQTVQASQVKKSIFPS